jgi:hypothetical protein
MPQIQVNEIDQSVVTRVVSDNKVKILCPIISSFGPGFDGTQDSVKTFTDVTDFNRAFGYTYAEFNPFQDDKSRMYARELIKKGAAVSVVRVNNGGRTASFNIEGSSSDRTTASYSTVCNAAFNAQELQEKIVSPESPATGSSATLNTHTNIVKGSVVITVEVYTTSQTTPDPQKVFIVSDSKEDGKFYANDSIIFSGDYIASIDYVTGEITATTPRASFIIKLAKAEYKYFDIPVDFNWTKYTFAPQIQSITAKYTGSFGNDIAVSISQINTTRLAESYQYANISVYYIDRDINYAYDPDANTSYIKSQTVKSVTLLETQLVSTNPNSPEYFEDVEFEFIKINAAPNAREELAIVWSNIDAAPNSVAQYSGFPVIPLKYVPSGASFTQYNFDVFMSNGSDFSYSDDTLEILRSGFKGYWSESDAWTVDDVNRYLTEVYGGDFMGDTFPGIIPNIYKNITECYKNFTDPYIYDFDFITSSGFVYEKYNLDYQYVTESTISLTGESGSKTATLSNKPVEKYTLTLKVGGTGVDAVALKDKVNDGGLTGNLVNATGDTQTVYGTITYSSGVITITNTDSAWSTLADVKYATAGEMKKISLEIPRASSVDEDVYTAFYTEVTPIHEAMRELVNTRQDCIALFDLPKDYKRTGLNSIVEYSRLLNTSYGTIHNPWCWINSPDVAGKQILMAPSYIFLYTFLFNLINNVESQKWFPPAGVDRATARVVTKPYYEIGSVILNEWQNDNISRVNPIMRLKQYGYIIYGQYTTLPAIDLYTHSALESLNVRLISNVIKKKIFDVCLNLAFNPNTEKLWLKFFAQLDPFLRYMKYNDGLYDYRIVMDKSTVTTDDINHLRCPGKVFIAPTRTAEFFDIDFIITEARAVFSD